MRLVLLGAPGAGKGTQASTLSKEYNIPQISTGDIFRSNIKSGTELGKKAKEFIDKGLLVPDEVTQDIVKDRLQQCDCENGFILDGFPRTIPQAEFLDSFLTQIGKPIEVVLNIHVPDEEITRRMSGRRVCPSCGASYHLIFNPPQSGDICDVCKSQIKQREDDKQETVLERLKTYHNQTEPLINFYNKQGKLLTVLGQEKVDQTTSKVLEAVKDFLRK